MNPYHNSITRLSFHTSHVLAIWLSGQPGHSLLTIMDFVVSLYTDICVLRELVHCRYAAISLSNFATEEDEKEHDGSRSTGNWVVSNLYGQLCDRYVIVLITSKEHIYWELPIYSV